MFISPCFFRNDDGVDNNDDFDYDLIPDANLCTNCEIFDMFSVKTKGLVDANCTRSSLFEEEQASGSTHAVSPADLENVTNNVNKPSFKLLIDLVSTSISQLGISEGNDKDSPQVCQHSAVPTFNSVLDVLKTRTALTLTLINKIAYEVICSTFLLKLLDETSLPVKHTLENIMKFKIKSRHR